jgi:hypothetical protein
VTGAAGRKGVLPLIVAIVAALGFALFGPGGEPARHRLATSSGWD